MEGSARRNRSARRTGVVARRPFGRRGKVLLAILTIAMLVLAGLMIWVAFGEDAEDVIVIVPQQQVAEAAALEGELSVVLGTVADYRPADHGDVEADVIEDDELVVVATAVLPSDAGGSGARGDVDELLDELAEMEGRRVAAAGRLAGRVGERAFALESPD